MKLMIMAHGAGVATASHADQIPVGFDRALRMAYRRMRMAGLSPADARSVLLTCYEVGVATGEAVGLPDPDYYGVDEVRRNGSASRHPSVTGRPLLTVVSS